MRTLLCMLTGCGMVMLVGCSRTEPPGAAGPAAAITSAVEGEAQLPAADSVDEAAESDLVMEGNTGLAVGQKAPSFLLADQAGRERSLDEFLNEGKVALVFHRSADW